MWSMPVVLVYPRFEAGISFCGVLVEPGVGPFSDGGLDEAFRLAVGSWGVDAGADVLDLKFPASIAEAVGVEKGPLSVITCRIPMLSGAK